MDSARLQEMMDYIDGQDVPMHAVLVIRHGRLVWEEYRGGYNPARSHDLQSVTKSFSSTLIGIAIRLGLIQDVQQRMVDLFPDHTMANMDARKGRITLEHLLTMSDGMDWHELDYPYDDERNTLGQMWVSKDAVQHVLDRPMVREPGASWAYNSGTSILLGGILEQVTGQDVLAFAREYLFEPIGVKSVTWSKTTGNHYHTDGGLYLTPRDMARLGQLMLNNGAWNGRQIVSPEWVAAATRTHHLTPWGQGYGYQWWTFPGSGVYQATGHYEQKIYVFPEADLVAVFTAYIADEDPHPTDGLFFRFIAPACTDLPDEALHRTYDGYGFTFAYPIGFVAAEAPIAGGDEVSDASGTVQFTFGSYPPEIVTVVWHQLDEEPDLQVALDQVFVSVSEQPGVEIARGDPVASSKGDHEMLRESLDITIEGFVLTGMTGAWYCPEAGRAFVLIHVTDSGVAAQQDTLAEFQRHLDAFACH